MYVAYLPWTDRSDRITLLHMPMHVGVINGGNTGSEVVNND